MLDMQEEIAERKAARTGKPFDRLFPDTPEGQLLRWKNFHHMSGKELHRHLKLYVYPYFASLGQHSEEEGLGTEGSAAQALGHIGEYMQDADLEIKNESVLVSAVEMVNNLPLTQSDVKGDIYEYLLSKLTTAGINGQFRTPRHIIDAMIELIDPQPTDVICDPSCGTAGFLARTMEYLNKKYSSEAGTFTDEDGNLHYTGDMLEPYRDHINKQMFWGFDFDTTMLRVSSMNMMLHGVNEPIIVNRDSLAEDHAGEMDKYSLILANPPFAGSLDYESTAKDLLQVVKTKKTELLFLALFLRLLKPGGRAAVIVPDGVLFGSSKAHKELRKSLVEDHKLDGIVSMPSGVFKPYAGVSTAIVFFHRTDSGGTDKVWFYDMQADGYSLDDKRTKQNKSDLDDILKRWQNLDAETDRARTDQSFMVPKAEIAENDYDLSINRYKEVVYQAVEYDEPKVILERIQKLDEAIADGRKVLEGMLG